MINLRIGPLPSIPRNAMMSLSQFCPSLKLQKPETQESIIAKLLFCSFCHQLSTVFTKKPISSPPPNPSVQATQTGRAPPVVADGHAFFPCDRVKRNDESLKQEMRAEKGSEYRSNRGHDGSFIKARLQLFLNEYEWSLFVFYFNQI